MSVTTPLQRDLVGRIVSMVHSDGLRPGDRINETGLAGRLSVSRTPIRTALSRLQRDGYLERRPNKGVVLLSLPPLSREEEPKGAEDPLIVIARLRREERLDEEFTEAELMRLSGLDRAAVRPALQKLEELGLTIRKGGYGWRFRDQVRDEAQRVESFRFRILIECAAILEPAFAPLPDWIEAMVARHERMLREAWSDFSSVALFEMNAEFHEGICLASGNRYLHEAIVRQNQLRRLSNYNWRHGQDRVLVTCREHLKILEQIADADFEVAAVLMRRHLQGASEISALKSSFRD